MREIKFRAWSKTIESMMTPWSIRTDGVVTEDPERDTIYMQFTGLKDKNGKEAYQDDIFRPWEDDRLYQIIWNDDYARFECKQLSGKRYPCDMLMVAYGEVIGNIYENKNLLHTDK